MAAVRDIVLVCVVTLHLVELVLSCPPSPRPPCSWTTCRTEWRNDWSPSHTPQGRCTEQRRRNHIITNRHHGRGRCPGSQRCHYSYQHSRLCSCLDVYSCPLHQWSAWTGTPPQGQCTKQSRYRNYNQQSRYVVRQHHCNGLKQSCGPTQYDYRTYCSCKYADCTLGTWSAWTDLPNPVHKDHCASQKRTRTYTLQWKFYPRRDNCNGVGPLQCPNAQEETREKVVTCPPLAVPAQGSWDRDDCKASPQICKSTCKLQCNVQNGYKLSGPRDRVCRVNGQWSTPWNSYCKDVQTPTITCPPRKEVGNDPGKDSAVVNLPQPTVKDNSGKPVRIDNDAGARSKAFKIQQDAHVIKYTATDADGNTASCTYHLTVKDKERPSVVKCPDDIVIRTNKNKVRVTWEYPVFKDNNDKEPHHPLRIKSNINPGNEISWGVHKVIYTAYDRAQNNVSCEFFVDVGPHKCPLFDPPNHGARACNRLVKNITYEMMCNVQCKDGYAFSKPAAGVYVCQSNGLWQKMINGFPLPVTDMENKPWPDCAPEEVANAAKKEFTFYTGSCGGDEQAAMQQIRHNFLKAIKDSPLANIALCQISQNQDCVVSNVKVYCGSNSKRSSENDAAQSRVIKFDFVIKDMKPSGDRKAEAAKLKKILQELVMLEGYLKNQFPTDSGMPGMKVEARKGDIFCEAPKVKRILKGDGSEIERSVCVECAVGSYYDNSTQSCVDCPIGQYQDDDGQTHCKPCPKSKASVRAGASSPLQCYDICKAGEFTHTSHGGAVTCLACPLGSYQHKPRSKSCIQCPDGRTTSSVGALSVADCQ